MINYLIIGSNNCAIQDIQNVLNNFKEFNLLGYSIEESEIMHCIHNQNAELLFINIDIAVEKITDLIFEIEKVKIVSPKLIAISETKEKAYTAFKLGFTDFLLMPLDKIEVKNAISRILNLNYFAKKNRICIKSYKDFQYVKLDSIIYLKADNNTTDFFLNDNSGISAYKTLKTYENLLPPNFIRIHRSFMVNINYISRIQYGKNTCTVKYLNTELPFSKTYLENVDKMKGFLTDNSV